MSATVAFAFGAGLVATVNPCGFALLPGFLSLYLGADDAEMVRASLLARMTQGVVVGAVLSLSFGAVFLAAGLTISIGVRSFIELIPWVAVVIGAGLTMVGVAMLAGRHVGLVQAGRARPGRMPARGYRRVALFGVTYAIASLSCTLAIFLAVIGQALATANPVELVAVFLAYAAGSASILMALSVSAALAKGALARAVRRLVPVVNRLAGALLTLSGAYLIVYWAPTLGSDGVPSSTFASRLATQLSSDLSGFLSTRQDTFAVLLAVTLIGGLALYLADQRRRRARRSPDDRGQAISHMRVD